MITHTLRVGGPFQNGTYSVSREAAGSYVNGVFVPGAPTVTSVDAAIQPVTGRDLKSLPEGQRAEDTRLMLSTFIMRERDTVTYAPLGRSAETWTVFRVEDWTFRGATWTRTWLSRNAFPV